MVGRLAAFVADHLFAWACRLHSKGFRNRFAADMNTLFRDRRQYLLEHCGLFCATRFAVSNIAAAAFWALVERCEELLRSRAPDRGWRAPTPSEDRPRTAGRLDGLEQDVRYGLRGLVRTPGFTTVGVLTLALGIGATTAIFSIVDGVLLRPLPFPEADRLTAVRVTRHGLSWWSASPADLQDWRRRSRAFARLAFFQPDSLNLVVENQPLQVPGARVSANFFATLAVEPTVGRGFADSDGETGATPVAVLSHAVWIQHFGGDRGVVGRTIPLDGRQTVVVGVLPRHFEATVVPLNGVFVPRAFSADEQSSRGRVLRVIGRLAEGLNLDRAQAEMDRVARQVSLDNPDAMEGWGIRLVPLRDELVGQVRPALLALLAAVACVLLVACANVANLVLARGLSRRRELALRSVLGAGRGRIVRQLLTESLLLGLLGGSLGLALAAAATNVMLSMSSVDLLGGSEVRLNLTVLFFAAGVSLLAGVVSGIIPAIRISHPAILPGVRFEAAATDAHGPQFFRAALVAAEMGAVVVLLAGAGLMLRSFDNLRRIQPGFSVDRRLVITLSLPRARYEDRAKVDSFYERLFERLERLPNVSAVGAVVSPPLLSPAGMTAYHLIEGRPIPPPGQEPIGGFEPATPGYFEAMGIPLLSGRPFSTRDTERSKPVALINETMAKLYWPYGAPIGGRIRLARTGPGAYEIVGVVGDIKYSLAEGTRPRVYVPFRQTPVPFRSAGIIVRTRLDEPLQLASAVRAAVAEVDRDQSPGEIREYREVLAHTLARPRAQAWLLMSFALLAIALGAVGVYGVVSCTVRQRTREVGIRIALGASPLEVTSGVVLRSMRPVAAGGALGVIAALAMSKAASPLLHPATSGDGKILAVAVLTLGIVAGLASWIPARRLSHVDPLASLRAE